MRKLLTFIALAIWTFGAAFAYEPPTLQCLQLNDATHLQKYLAEYDGIVLGKQS